MPLFQATSTMDNFHIEGDGNEEKVFEINFEYNAGKGRGAV